MSNPEEIKKEIKKFSSIVAVSNTEGGKLITKSIQKDIVSSVDEIINKYKTLSHIELIALCARLGERLSLLRVLTKAKKLKKLAEEELEYLLKEE